MRLGAMCAAQDEPDRFIAVDPMGTRSCWIDMGEWPARRFSR